VINRRDEDSTHDEICAPINKALCFKAGAQPKRPACSALRLEPRRMGTFVDSEFQMARETAWVERTLADTRESALLIRGAVHVLSVARKLKEAGASVKPHLFLPREDEPQ
jgi:hypothetical protein